MTESSDIQERGANTDEYWGYYWAEVGQIQGPNFDNMTMAQCAHLELSAIERILARVLNRT